VWDEHAEELKTLTENLEQDELIAPRLPYFRAVCALHEGDYTSAKHFLEQTGAEKASLLAIIAHHEGNATAAANWLADAQERDYDLLCDRAHFESRWWPDVVRHAIAFRNAERLITGQTTASDEHLATLHNDALSRTANADPETASFDHLIETFPITNEHKPTFRWLARGRRLAELGRFDEAAADFNKAVELAPDDIDVLTARARFEAERGNLSEASAAFQTALEFAESARSTDPQAWEVVEREIGLQEALLDDWLARTPNNARLWRVSAQRQFQLGKWQEAAESLEHGRHDSHELMLAILYCLLGDDDAWREACRDHAELLPDDYLERFREFLRLYVLGLQPATGEELAELTQRMEARLLDPPRSRWERVPLGLALYRHGRYDEALRILNEALSPQGYWQEDARVWPLLAMTHWQLDHQEEARKWLERSAWWIDLAARAVDVRHAIGPDNIGNNEWLCAHLFYCEAAALIGAEPPADAEPSTIRSVARVVARVNAELGAWDRAAKWHAALGDWETAVELSGRARSGETELTDDLRELLVELSEELAGNDQWALAAQTYEWLWEDSPTDFDLHRSLAFCEFLSNGPDAYRERCRTIVAHAAASDDVKAKRKAVSACILIRDALEDMNVLLDLAREVDAAAPDPPVFTRKVLAGALFRAGRIDEAIPVLHAIETDETDQVRGQVLFLLAMAYHARGEEETATEWLQQGDLWTEQATANGELERWERALKVQLWQQEAHQRLGVPLAGDDDPPMEAKPD
jgi:tetratricopeptide (TPR) repeat protein